MPVEPVSLAEQNARIAARQEAGRLHREAMYQHRLAYQRAWARAHYRPLQTSIGDFDKALIARAEALATARAVAEGELRELVDEQARDERWGHLIRKRPWMISLDATDSYGRSYHELVAA